MYKKILVPVDDSKASLKALKEACALAKQCGSSLHAIHVVDLAQFSWSGTGYLQSSEVHEASKEVGSKILQRAIEVIESYGVAHEMEVLENAGEKVASIIAKSVKRNECDLVVMGTHGFSGVMHLLMGSVAEGVLRQVDVPVMLIRKADD
ncbi:MAG: universal stress protein [Neisseria sp.]|nr:universal stress protein [Neisseria sp.]